MAAGLDMLAFVTDPLRQLVSWGVGWLIEHVRPLSDALDALAGDPDQITAYARTWQNVTQSTIGAQKLLHDGAARQITDWTGRASTAYRHLAAEQDAALAALAKANQAPSYLTVGAGRWWPRFR